MKSPTLVLSGGPGLPIYVGSMLQTTNGRLYEVSRVAHREHSTGFTAVPFGRPISVREARIH